MPGNGKVVVEEVSGLPKMFWEITMSQVFEREDGKIPEDGRVLLDPSTVLSDAHRGCRWFLSLCEEETINGLPLLPKACTRFNNKWLASFGRRPE
jgi:hypothetical protein